MFVGRLYDPRVPELKAMLLQDAFFPSDKFSDPETLEILVKLGLKKVLSFTGLLDSAKSVSMLQNSGVSETMSARHLLACLDTVALKLSHMEEMSNLEESKSAMESQGSVSNEGEENIRDCGETLFDDSKIDLLLGNLNNDIPEEKFWSDLKCISWCPVLRQPPIQGLPWLASGQNIATPGTVRPKSQMWLASSKMHILDGDSCSQLQYKLGWKDQLDIEILSSQLIELSNSYTLLKENSCNKQDFDSDLQQQILSLYSQLQGCISTDKLNFLRSVLDGVRWVWIGDDFVQSTALAFDAPVQYSPYLYAVPSELSEYRDLLLALGVRLSFDLPDYLHVLQQLQHDVKNSPLSTDELSFVLCILEAVAESYLDRIEYEVYHSHLWIPNSSGVLVSAENVVYNDAPWMENNLLDGKQVVHPSISHDLAGKLGIQSLRSISLVSEDMAKDFPCMDYARLSELLELYGSNDLLLFDLLEMADCCKAKKLHLILDKREHPRLSLLQHNLGN